MQLVLLRSRLVASLIASCLLPLLCLFLIPPNVALAAELTDTLPIVFDGVAFSPYTAARGLLDPTYEPDFLPFDRSIIGRAPAGVTSLTNNEATPMNVEEGTTQRFVFMLPDVAEAEEEEVEESEKEKGKEEEEEKEEEEGAEGEEEEENEGDRLESRAGYNASQEKNVGAGAAEYEVARGRETHVLRRRQTPRRVYISANTCQQPQPVDPSKTTSDPPQLTLFVSTSEENQTPGPSEDAETQTLIEFKEGAVMYNVTTSRAVYIGVHAPNVSEAFSGTYNFRIAASMDSYYYSYDEHSDADLIWVDSDSQGALLMTHNLTDKADPTLEAKLMKSQPYVLFAHNKKDRAINGLKYSYCGLQNYAQIAATRHGKQTNMVRTGVTKRGPGNLPKQQFFFSGLNSSTEYVGILAQDGNQMGKRQNTAEAGGKVFKEMRFSTKSGKTDTQGSAPS